MEIKPTIQLILKTLPDLPGVYQYFDAEGNLIYVGKAKSLKKRVSSYFTKDIFDNFKTKVLVGHVADIKTIVVDTELDALLLENNLIKQHQPRYNVLLKDDKTYPWIVIKNEPFPRIFSTRKLIRDGSEYFGPYPSVKIMNNLLELVRQLYPIRTCRLPLEEKAIAKGKFKVCLEYHIGNCLGPCEGHQSEADYLQSIQEIKEIFKGRLTELMQMMQQRMMDYAAQLLFEKAAKIKHRIALLEKFKSKSTIVNNELGRLDVFSFYANEKVAYINYMGLNEGRIVNAHTLSIRKKMDEANPQLLALGIVELRQQFESNTREVIVPFLPDLESTAQLQFHVPKRGDKKKLLELSERNVLQYIKEIEKQQELVDPERHTKRILEQLKKDFRLSELPVHIECFDNSNFQGSYPVSAMVCFKNAKPSKKDYRHFIVRTVQGPNDFATMQEVITRRYSRLLQEGATLPQLIVVDGGKGQLSAALEALEKLQLRGKVAIVGIAKRLEEIYFPEDPVPLYIDKKSESLKVIQHLRNEAHRFGITHHRKRREKGTIKTELSEIAGIGEKIAEKLLNQFKSVAGVKRASLNQLAALVGEAKAKAIHTHFNSNP